MSNATNLGAADGPGVAPLLTIADAAERAGASARPMRHRINRRGLPGAGDRGRLPSLPSVAVVNWRQPPSIPLQPSEPLLPPARRSLLRRIGSVVWRFVSTFFLFLLVSFSALAFPFVLVWIVGLNLDENRYFTSSPWASLGVYLAGTLTVTIAMKVAVGYYAKVICRVFDGLAASGALPRTAANPDDFVESLRRRRPLKGRNVDRLWFAIMGGALLALPLALYAQPFGVLTVVGLYGVVLPIVWQSHASSAFKRIFERYEVTPRSFHPDRCNGFYPFGAYVLRSCLIVVVCWFLLSLTLASASFVWTAAYLYDDDQGSDVVGFALAQTVLLVLALVPTILLPSWRAHSTMLVAKKRALEPVTRRMSELVTELADAGDPLEFAQHMEAIMKLREVEAMLEKSWRAWPLPLSPRRLLAAPLALLVPLVPTIASMLTEVA